MNIKLQLQDLKIDTTISVTQLHIRGQIWPLYTLILKVALVLDNIIIYALFYLEIFVLTNLDFLLCANSVDVSLSWNLWCLFVVCFPGERLVANYVAFLPPWRLPLCGNVGKILTIWSLGVGFLMWPYSWRICSWGT